MSDYIKEVIKKRHSLIYWTDSGKDTDIIVVQNNNHMNSHGA